MQCQAGCRYRRRAEREEKQQCVRERMHARGRIPGGGARPGNVNRDDQDRERECGGVAADNHTDPGRPCKTVQAVERLGERHGNR